MMKKIVLMLVLIGLVVSTQAQSQLTTVRGKTKDGKTIKVEYYKGNVEDYVESVKYQLVDELQARANELQSKLDAANKQIKDLKSGSHSDKSKQIDELSTEIEMLNERIGLLNGQLTEKKISYDSLVAVNKGLDNALSTCEKRVEVLLNSRPASTPKTSTVICAVLGLGPAFPRGVEEGWSKEVNWMKKVEVYCGTPSLSSSFPISVEGGLGIRSFKLSASRAPYEYTESGIDADGDPFQAMYSFGALQEGLSLTYLDIPIRACFGQPAKDYVSVYAKVGVTPSIKLSGKFQGSGTYSLEGYYPQWDVTLVNIDELEFGTDLEYYTADKTPKVNGFVLWGNAMVGAYVPFKGSPLLLNAGLGIDVPLMNLTKCNAGTKAVIPSCEIGLVIAL